MNNPKKQHYLSQCYLNGFTNSGRKLATLSLNDGRVFYAGPHNVGAETYFNSFKTADGMMSNVIESARSKFEADVAKAIRNVETLEKIEGDDRITILNLMSLFAVSNPFRREQHNNMIDFIAKRVLHIAASKVGYKVNGVLITEEHKKLFEEDKFKVEFSKSTHIYNEYFEFFETVLATMLNRKWTLVKAPNEQRFVTCDFPIALIWKNPEKYHTGPGFGCGDTQVFFTLSRKLALIGDFEGYDQVVHAEKDTVALINSNILCFAKKQVYAPHENISFWGTRNEILEGLKTYYETFHANNRELTVPEDLVV
ncbi:DUF4238 domain-containing protein [Candidatus Berkiella cookevillensis]|uniref:DUF4238 domain-containing protein n=1 Tax=Candidatus Berkiella cookevillensis TaxID=437022 RepID=A0A0Q9YBR9_9GAMM|nr:DUF4238 domain-containing protein [Candidatus Berkiella cookevillensis]MCS5709200.1 DUF4238 domain-containing protein [Candidatus Berkiella cookevillensis]